MPALLVAVAGLELEHRFGAVRRIRHRVEDAVLRRHERRELREDHVRHGGEIALTLEHARKALQVRLQPVLLDVLPRCLPQVADHLVQLVLQNGDLTLGLHPDLPREVALGDGGRNLGDGAHLVGEIRGQLVDVVSQVLPDPCDLFRLRLPAELPFDSHFARDSSHLTRERVELVDHGIDGVLQFEELAFDVDRDLLAQVAVGDRGGHLRDVSHLTGQVAGHQVDVVGEVLPDTTDLDGDRGGLTELALGADLARDARHLGDEAVELIDHRVDGVLQLEHLAADVDRDLLAQVSVGDGTDHALHLDRRSHEVVDQAVDRLHALRPRLVPREHDALRELALFADDLTDPRKLGSEGLVGDDDVVETVGDLAGHTDPLVRHADTEVTRPQLSQHTQQHRDVDGVVRGHR